MKSFTPAFLIALEVVIATWLAGLIVIAAFLIRYMRKAAAERKANAEHIRRQYGEIFEVAG